MKKSTVLIVVITFLVSVIIVGIFGMRIMSYNARVYVERITPTEVITSTYVRGAKISPIQGRENTYGVILPFNEGMVVSIGYEIDPADATNRNVELTVTSGGEFVEVDGMNITLKGEGSVRLNYRATDGNGKSIVVWMTVVSPEYYYANIV